MAASRWAAPLATTLVIACGAMGACGSGATDDPGTDASMQIAGAQFHRGSLPRGSPTAPGVASVVVINSFLHADDVNYPISGALDPGATAVAIGLEADVGYWITPAGLPNVATPNDPSYAATATFSAALAPGNHTLIVRAIDGEGNFGPSATQTLTVLSVAPPGVLTISLTWDTESDLDLHVVDPAGSEIYHGDMSDRPPPFAPQPEGGSYGYLDWDSNANCIIDGKREEDVVWPDAPPPGHYIVRVDAASLCSQPIAHFAVSAVLAGQPIGEAQGVMLDADTRGSHGLGAGVTALDLDVP